jgi:hypothetical protein
VPIAETAVLVAAAFAAGAMNAMAGGGSFLTLPALVYAGVPPVAANATGTAALLPGYASSAYGFRRDIRPVAGIGVGRLAAVSLAGGLAGAALLLLTPDGVFRAVVPWLLLAATALFAFGGRLSAGLRRLGRGRAGGDAGRPARRLGLRRLLQRRARHPAARPARPVRPVRPERDERAQEPALGRADRRGGRGLRGGRGGALAGGRGDGAGRGRGRLPRGAAGAPDPARGLRAGIVAVGLCMTAAFLAAG